MNKAEREILIHVQKESFQEEIATLKIASLKVGTEGAAKPNKAQVKKSSRIFKLDPQLTDGLLRVGGRLQKSPLQLDAKHPIILPASHHVVRLIISFYHHTSGHSGTEHVLSMIRERFWIVKARAAVKRVLHDCFSCRKRQAPAGEQKMADLPQDRITPDKPPFTYVGVDCFGPFLVRRGRSQAKRYGVIFTCLTVRAIHIEVAHSLDTDSFVNCMRRFIARRGQPEKIRSDNGGNFVRGEKELRDAIDGWNQKVIAESLLQRNVQWVFNPPSRLSSRWRMGALYSHHSKGDECPIKATGPRRWRTCHSHVWGRIHNQWKTPYKGVRRSTRPWGPHAKSPSSVTVCYFTSAWCFQEGRRLLPSEVATSSISIRRVLA